MDKKIGPNRASLPDDFPTELIEPMKRLFRRRERLNIRLLPQDAWTICALIQFADRNPGLSTAHHELLHEFGNQLIAILANIEPIVEPYLLMGWNPEYDVPKSTKKEP